MSLQLVSQVLLELSQRFYSEQGVDKEYLTELVFSNMRKFDGNIRAYVYDNLKKKKTTALIINRESLPPKSELTNLLG